jgi:hypothetical protein
MTTGSGNIRDLRYIITVLFLIVSISFYNNIFSQDLMINEVMASNATIITDNFGEYSDWIEIYNYGSTPVDLNGYGLSDHKSDPFMWTFPAITIQPSEYMLIYATDRDITEIGLHYKTIVDWSDYFRYIIPTEEPPGDWNTVGFNDASWGEGPSGFGYADDDDATIVPTATISVYMRKVFSVADTSGIISAILHVDYDDGFVAYLNGVEIARANIGTQGTPPSYNDSTQVDHEAQIYNGGSPDMFDIDLGESLLNEGNNVLAIQVHNVSSSSSDMTLIPFFTLCGKNAFAGGDYVNPVLNFAQSALHTNFKINSDGDTLVLSAPGGAVVDEKLTGDIPVDISLGRKPDATHNWYYFTEPTPGAANTTQEYSITSQEKPVLSHSGGFYTSSFNLTITPVNAGDPLCYTTDGSVPTLSSSLYSSPISISSTTVLRARVIKPDEIPGPVVSCTYFRERTFDLPVISVYTDPYHLWDYNEGMYADGPGWTSGFPYFGANFWNDWEKPAHIEMYEPDGTLAFSIDAGIKIFGGWSRAFPQKSLSVFARRKYGDADIEYTIFPDKSISEFEAIVLRNSGNDWNSTMFRDAMITSLCSPLGIDVQAYRPAVIFLNGEYWGFLNIREKVNEHYVASNYNLDPDSIDLLENTGEVIHGDGAHYTDMYNFIANNNMANSANYEYIKTQMEVDNFIRYQLSQIYCNNQDWPGNNLKFWRPAVDGGRYRWIMYDTDFGFSIWTEDHWENTLAFALDPNGDSWPNPPWATLIFRKLTENTEFRSSFINQFADRLNTNFKAENVIEHIDNLITVIEDELPYHSDRWGEPNNFWDKVDDMKMFAELRADYVRQHILDQWPSVTTEHNPININVYPENAGRIKINTIYPDEYPWSGRYFKDVPIELTAFPNEGYRFVEWTGNISWEEETISVNPSQQLSFTANFEYDSTILSPVVINEINYRSHPSRDTEDWIELYNRTDSAVNISGWVFKDSEDIHSYVFPGSTVMQSDDYLVVCRDVIDFLSYFPDITNYVGNFNFGLSSYGECLRLYDNSSNLKDSVPYGVTYPWPPEPYNTVATLELIDPMLDNCLPESWTADASHGTPGMANDTNVNIPKVISDEPEMDGWLELYPNPFSNEANIRLNLKYLETARIMIYNINGEVKRIFTVNAVDAGIKTLTWNGTDNKGNKLPNGLYLIRVVTGSNQTSDRILLMR